MAASNGLWGAERIRGELLTLGIGVSKRTIQKYMRSVRPPARRGGQRWRTFLRNHSVRAGDFVQTYDIWFRPIFALLIVDVHSKRVVHWRRPAARLNSGRAPPPRCFAHFVRENMGPNSGTPRPSLVLGPTGMLE